MKAEWSRLETIQQRRRLLSLQWVSTKISGSEAQQFRGCYLYYLHYFVNNIDLKEYGDFYGFDLDFDDSEIHRKYNIFRGNESQKVQKWTQYPNMNVWYSKMFGSKDMLQYGLFYEMMRYLFGVFPEIYDFHFNLISDPENELKMEVWMTDFDRNINVILDRLNLINSLENREILNRNGLDDVDIAKERQRLYGWLKTQDMSQVEITNDDDDDDDQDLKMNKAQIEQIEKRNHGEYRKVMGSVMKPYSSFSHISLGGHRRREMPLTSSSHVHQGRNNTMYINALLSLDSQICLVLKHITKLINYGWSYAEYC